MSFSIYIAASFKQAHAVKLLHREIRSLCPKIIVHDWTALATPPEGLNAAKRRVWYDTDAGGVYDFCRSACTTSKLVIYLGQSGQDAGIEIGMAAASGIDIIGLRGPLEDVGLMLHGAVGIWANSLEELLEYVENALQAHWLRHDKNCDSCDVVNCCGRNDKINKAFLA